MAVHNDIVSHSSNVLCGMQVDLWSIGITCIEMGKLVLFSNALFYIRLSLSS